MTRQVTRQVTRQDLILAVLERLNVVGVGQAPAAEDIATVSARLDGQLAQLARRGVVYVPDADTLDEELVDPLAAIIASACAPAYGQAPNRSTVIEAENTLREMQPGDGAGRGSIGALYY